MLGITPVRPKALASSSLREIFASVDHGSCPNFLNFHLHTVYSDGQLQPQELIEQAIATELTNLAITDHHTVAGYREARRFLEEFVQTVSIPFKLPDLWVGVEINASLLFTEVHILGYAFDPNEESISPYLQGKTTAGIDYQAKSVIDAIHEAGGIAILAHPARYRRSPEDLIPAAATLGIDGIETYYSYGNSNPWVPTPRQTEQVKALGDRFGLLHTCGTDSHGFRITSRL